MANLSDLLAVGAAPRAVPGWIALLGGDGGFCAGTPVAPPDPAPQDCASDPDALHAAAVSAAYESGHADGLAAAQQQQAGTDAARQGLELAFARLDKAARAALSQRLAAAVAALCEQVIEPALVNREAISARCTALAQSLDDAAAACSLHLNPDDIPLLSPATASAWTLCPDPSLARGTVVLEHAEGALADGPEEWRRLIAAALGA